MDLSKLKDVSFADYGEETVKNALISAYESVSGRTLATGDPVRLFLLSIAAIIIQQRFLIDQAGKMNLVAYAKGDYLDQLGAYLDVERIPATAAETTLQYTLSAVRPEAVVIPKGTKVTGAKKDVFFATESPLVIASGSLSGTVDAQCTSVGLTGEGLPAGYLTEQVDPLPYIASVTNTTTTSGGADIETDDSYRERIREAPEKFSDAGSYGAYQFWAKSASADIMTVGVSSPTAGTVQLIPLLKGGQIPGENLRKRVLEICSAEKVRPLTDNVTCIAPTEVSYDIDATYKINTDDAAAITDIQAAVTKAVDDYITWQRSDLGRDIDPSKLYQLMVDAGAVKVQIAKPTLIALTNDQLAVSGKKTVTFGGLANG